MTFIYMFLSICILDPEFYDKYKTRSSDCSAAAYDIRWKCVDVRAYDLEEQTASWIAVEMIRFRSG